MPRDIEGALREAMNEAHRAGWLIAAGGYFYEAAEEDPPAIAPPPRFCCPMGAVVLQAGDGPCDEELTIRIAARTLGVTQAFVRAFASGFDAADFASDPDHEFVRHPRRAFRLGEQLRADVERIRAEDRPAAHDAGRSEGG